MSGLVRLSRISCLTGTISALWLCAAGSAWAGDGGSSLASLQALLNTVCGNLNVTCPQLPTITQAALEIAAQFNAPTEMVRSQDNDPPALIAANPPLASAQPPLDLSTSTPLAFVGSTSVTGQAAATQPYDENANGFFYAVTSIGGPNAQPNTVHFVYEDLFRTIDGVSKGQHVANISLPLVVLNGVAERVVQTTLQFFATCNGGFASCVTTALATGDFSGKGKSKTYSADQIGLSIASSFGPSPISPLVPHATFQVDVPLIVTSATDPLYLQSPPKNAVLFQAFFGPETGFIPKNPSILGTSTSSIGIAPFAAPLCPGNVDCSATPPQGVFGFCASLPDNRAALLPAVAAFAAVATSGETLVSAPFGSSPKIVCPMF